MMMMMMMMVVENDVDRRTLRKAVKISISMSRVEFPATKSWISTPALFLFNGNYQNAQRCSVAFAAITFFSLLSGTEIHNFKRPLNCPTKTLCLGWQISMTACHHHWRFFFSSKLSLANHASPSDNWQLYTPQQANLSRTAKNGYRPLDFSVISERLVMSRSKNLEAWKISAAASFSCRLFPLVKR